MVANKIRNERVKGYNEKNSSLLFGKDVIALYSSIHY
jgi:hypothetical protein